MSASLAIGYRMNISRKARVLVVWLVLVAAVAVSGEESFFDRQLDRAITLLKTNLDTRAAFLHIYSVWDLADFARWDGRIPSLLTEILAAPEASPLLKGYSLWFLREVDLRRGDFEGARQKQAQLGFVTDWLIIGPFDNEGMAGFDLAYPPEKEINLAATYNGKERPVAWRAYPKVSFDCTVDLGATLRPASKTVAYALACVFSPERQPVAVRLGSDDCDKVWLGEKLVHADRDCHPVGFDQAVAGATLEKGWNKLLLKVCQDDGAWQFRLRLTPPEGGDGSPLASLRHAVGRAEIAKALEEIPPEKDANAPKDISGQPPVADPISELKKLVEAHPDAPEHHAALSFLYSHAKAFDRETRADITELETAVTLAPNNWKYYFRLGELHKDENKKRAAYERAVQLNPDYAPSYSRLAKHYSERNLERKSVGFYRQAVERDSSYYPALLGLAKHLSRNSRKPEAAKLFRDVLRAHPDTPYLLSYAVGFAPFPSSPLDSEKRCELALRFNFCDRRLRGSLLSNYYQRNELEAVLRQLELIERVNPMDTSVTLDHAALLSDDGRYDEAMSLIDRDLRICPEDDLALRQKGELLLRQGRRDDALTSFQRALAVKPQNAALRLYVEFLKPKEKPFEDAYKADAAQLIKDTSSQSGGEGDSAKYLFDLWVREVHANGLSNSYHQEIVRILSEAGVQNFRIRRATYCPGTHEIRVKAAKVFKKDGRVINADGPFSYPLGGEDRVYYDLEAKYVRFSNLQAGDTIEFSYRADAIAPRNMYGDYFGDIVYLKGSVPKRKMEYVVIAPPARRLFYKVVGVNPEPVVETGNRGAVYKWELANISKLEPEPLMPGYSEALPYIHISTYGDWDSVGEWYWNLIRDQFLLDASGKAEAARVTRGLKTEREKIVAICNYVVRNTRYIGLEFGIHSHKPYPAYKVLARGYGDCKDKAGLMLAMLKEVGVDASMAVLRTKNRGRIAPQPASLAVFNHVICYVPQYDMWLDGTAEYSGTSELPYEDQGADVLLVGKGVRRFVTTPVLGSERNLTSDTYQATILPDGGIEFELTGQVLGQYAPYYRRRYQETKNRENALRKSWGTVLPNISISEVDFDDLRELEKPVGYAFRASAPNYAVTDESGGMGFTGLIRKLHLGRRYASLSERKHDMVFAFPWSAKASIVFRLPSAYGVVSLPEDMHLKSDFGKCDIEFTPMWHPAGGGTRENHGQDAHATSLRIADCGLQIADTSLRIADCGLQIADSDAAGLIPKSEFALASSVRIADTSLRIADSGLQIADSDTAGPIPKSEIRNPKSDAPDGVAVSFHFSLDVRRVKVEQYSAFRDFCRQIDEKLAEKIRIAR